MEDAQEACSKDIEGLGWMSDMLYVSIKCDRVVGSETSMIPVTTSATMYIDRIMSNRHNQSLKTLRCSPRCLSVARDALRLRSNQAGEKARATWAERGTHTVPQTYQKSRLLLRKAAQMAVCVGVTVIKVFTATEYVP